MPDDSTPIRSVPSAVRICPTDPGAPAARALIDALSETLADITGDSGRASFDPEDVRGPRAMFVVAVGPDGEAVGCGAFRPLDGDTAELKRMYARPGSRGVGDAVLDFLESAAMAVGYSALWLETRRVNRRAVDFYLRRGYREIPRFGRYAGMPEAICLARALGKTPA
jgi:ribosomal protein S18 acetylase RimI-like enzyme